MNVREHAPDMDDTALERAMRSSRAVERSSALSASTDRWCRGFAGGLPERFWVHDDEHAQAATRQLGCPAFTHGAHIFLGRLTPESREPVLRHEIVHVAQVEHARRTGSIAPRGVVEAEAELLAGYPAARPVRHGADPQSCYGVWWVAIGVGLYMLIRPGVANAPGLSSPIVRSPSLTQIGFEAIALFVIPGGAIALGGRLGIGFLGTTAFAGAIGNVSFRGVQDVGRGEASPPLLYLFDASTGAIVGFVVPGGVRLIGKAGTWALDGLATQGLVRADIAITEQLAREAALAPLDAVRAEAILAQTGAIGRVSQRWLQHRGLFVLYRGQAQDTAAILSPLARSEGLAASQELVERMRLFRITDTEMATFSARYHDLRFPRSFVEPYGAHELAGLQLGGVGIPTTRIPGIAANFGEQGVIYVLRVPRSLVTKPDPWQHLVLEKEFTIFNSVPSGSVLRVIPAHEVAPLTVNGQGLMVPGTRVP